MKTKFFIISLIAGVTLMTSCLTNAPTEADMQGYMKALQQYYPYSLGDSYVYFNENLNRTWEISTYEMPDFRISVYNNPSVKNYGDRGGSIYASFLEKGVASIEDEESSIATYLRNSGDSNMNVIWSVKIRLSADDFFSGGIEYGCPHREFLSQLTDTIILPLTQKRAPDSDYRSFISAPEGSYARIVRGKGLTEFCVDGETVWHKVEE